MTSGPPRKLFTAARISSAKRRSCAAHDGDRVARVNVPASNATGSECAAIDFPATRGQRGARTSTSGGFARRIWPLKIAGKTFPISCTLPRSLLCCATRPAAIAPEQRGESLRVGPGPGLAQFANPLPALKPAELILQQEAGQDLAASLLLRYETLSGYRIRHIEFYEAFAALRLSILMHRAGNIMIAAGLLPPDAPMKLNNPASQLLAKLLDLPAPAGVVQSFIGNR